MQKSSDFRCPSSFFGERCQFVNPCSSSPCQNGGTCNAEFRGGVRYTCTCPLGYQDSRCLTRKDNACLSGPCRNGGTCELVLNEKNYRCRCPPGWTGDTCQQADPCASNPCGNGGTCVPFDSQYVCKCLEGFHGETCKQDVNECKQNPCKNGGTCINGFGSFSCQCRSRFTGNFCENPYVPCNPSPCQNGGTCRQTDDISYDCTCLP
ncbi:hypothetical protein AB205_0209180, partial [Aquarana catesbeiana]